LSLVWTCIRQDNADAKALDKYASIALNACVCLKIRSVTLVRISHKALTTSGPSFQDCTEHSKRETRILLWLRNDAWPSEWFANWHVVYMNISLLCMFNTENAWRNVWHNCIFNLTWNPPRHLTHFWSCD
jgi:hypothetical protein